ncbi:phage major capsid protein [Acinetobacter sp. KS-LM10]|uniref:phage major capsid protein n=1 Tax=Acinetobacter sp. KS-LM10 TaxID=3120518 RepID=UPI0030CF8AC5
MTDTVKLENEYKQVQTDLKKVGDDVKQYAENVEKQVKQFGDANTETKQKADEALSKYNELNASIKELQQSLDRPNTPSQAERKTVGQRVIESDDFKNNASSTFKGNMRIAMPRQAILTAGGPAVTADNQGIIAPIFQRMTVRDLIAGGQTNSNAIEYTVESGFTNNATTVAENTAKPYSDIQFDNITANVRTIAHLFKASRQIMDDAPALQSYIDARARYGLQLAEERQLLLGNGAGQNLHGIIPQAQSFDETLVKIGNATSIDRIRYALLQAVLAELPSTGIVLNPIDWAGIQLTKDNEGRYIIGNPINGNAPTLWNLPTVETQAMAVDTFLTGAFSMGAQIFDRMDIEVLISTENDKNFEQNMISIRAEERLALAVYRPEAFVTGSFTPTP